MVGSGQGARASVNVSSLGDETGIGFEGEDGGLMEDEVSPKGYQVEQGTLNLSPVNKSFVIMAEFIPSWLIMLAGKTTMSDLYLFVEREDLSLRRSLGLMKKFPVTPFIEEFIQWPWVECQNPREQVVASN